MSDEEQKLLQFIKVIDNLAQLYEWEMKNFPLLTTLTGRLLYFRIASRSIGNRENLFKSMKDLIGDSEYTEKALRTRIISMEKEGYISFVRSDDDGRNKFPIPTDKFFAAVYLHAGQMQRIFEKDFLMIEK